MNADTAELHRLLNNLIRLGTIAEVDHVAALARVQIGQLLTEWRPWSTQRAGNARTWWAPSAGEQVMFFSPGGDMASGIIMSSVYSAINQTPSHSPTVNTATYPDGAVIQYDHESHALTATLPDGGSAVLTAPASVTVISEAITLDAPETTCTGNLTVQQKLTYKGGMAGSGGAGAAAVIDGAVQTTGDVEIAGKSFLNHTHQEQGDNASTSAPT